MDKKYKVNNKEFDDLNDFFDCVDSSTTIESKTRPELYNYDNETKDKIHNVIKNKDQDTFIKWNNRLENTDIDFTSINQNAIWNKLLFTLPQLKKENLIIDELGNSIYNFDNLSFTLEYDKVIWVNVSKLMAYIGYKFNNGQSIVLYKEYAKHRGIKDKTAQDEIKQCTEILKVIKNINYTNKKNKKEQLPSLFKEINKITGGYIFVMQYDISEFNTLIPKDTFKLGKNTFLLTIYIYQIARQLNKTEFNLSISHCMEQLTIPHKDNVKKSDYKKLIIDPFDNIINEVPNCSIEYVSGECQDNIISFLDDSIKVIMRHRGFAYIIKYYWGKFKRKKK